MKTLSNVWLNIKKYYMLYLMISVALLFCILFHYLPMFGLLIAFKKYDLITGLKGTKWVGLKYFIDFFKDPYCFRLIRNTFLLGFLNVAALYVVPVVFALLLNEVKNKHFKKIAQSVSYFPYFISVVVVAGLIFQIFSSDGIINKNIIEPLSGHTIRFFVDPKWFRLIFVLSELWQKVGYNSIIFLAALTGIDLELYEAAIIDGANRWKQVLHITIPGIYPTMMVVLLLNVGRIVRVSFEKVMVLYNPSIYETADVLSTYIYRRGILGFEFSYTTAVGFFNSVLSFLLVIIANALCKKFETERLW